MRAFEAGPGHAAQLFGLINLNVVQQMNSSRGDVAYTVIDIDLGDGASSEFAQWDALQEVLASIDGVISTRIVGELAAAAPDEGFALMQEDGKVWLGPPDSA